MEYRINQRTGDRISVIGIFYRQIRMDHRCGDDKKVRGLAA